MYISKRSGFYEGLIPLAEEIAERLSQVYRGQTLTDQPTYWNERD
jgi:hypothetical protein